MTKVLYAVIVAQLLISPVSAQVEFGKIDSLNRLGPFLHPIPEYTFDQPLNPTRWNQLDPRLYIAFGSTDQTYFRTEVPDLDSGKKTWEATGWRGERLNALLVAWAPDSIRQVRFVINDLINEKGNVLDKNNLDIKIIRYVLSNYPYNARGFGCGEGPVDKAYLLPDRLESFSRFDLPARSVRSIWLSVEIPANTIPGLYQGTIQAESETGTVILKLAVHVQSPVLPPPKEWTFQLDLWQNPWVIAHYYGLKPWSAEHRELLKKHLWLYADAGGKFITTYAVHSPWAEVTYHPDEGMVEWVKLKNGSWKFDYRIFDEYIRLAMEAGIDKAITIYTPLPWGERFRYLDEATNNYVYERWAPSSDTFITNWNIFLTDLKDHLKKKKWLGRSYLGINENAMEQTLAALRLIKKHSAEWKVTYAGDWHPALDSLLDDYSNVFGKEPSPENTSKRRLKGHTTTFYICCTPDKPNTFVFSPPAEGRWLGWYALARGYDGLLRWAYDSWPSDPVRDARHTYWGAGDCFMVYPGAASSVRFEKMREGIADFEKIKLLRANAARSASAQIHNLMKQLEDHLKIFLAEKEFNTEKIIMDLEQGKKFINELSEKLK